MSFLKNLFGGAKLDGSALARMRALMEKRAAALAAIAVADAAAVAAVQP